jgi:hypothetical protein
VYDHGNIEQFNNDTAWFTFNNTGSKNIYLLSTQPRQDYEILCPGKTIEPGASWTIGIIYYTSQKGKFNIKVPLYFSHLQTALELEVKGQIKSILPSALSTCPSIENSKPLQPNQIPLAIILKDEQTQETLDKADVTVINQNNTYKCVTGINSKTYKCKTTYGFLNITANKSGYEPKAVDFRYDPANYTCIIELRKNYTTEDSITPAEIPQEPVIIKEKEPEPKPLEPVSKEKKTIVKTDSIVTIPDYVYIPSSVSDSGFNSYRYKPNHLIFIIDVSGSMKDSTKLYFLKQAMHQLIADVRPQDHITLMTYNSKVRVIFENYSGLDRKAMMTAIDTLTAKGGSNGAHSIQMAYDLSKQYFIKGGNNQIFLATDGLFNSSKISNEDLYKSAAKYHIFHGVKLSTIGFGKDEKALDFLKKLSQFGRGNFLSIERIPADIAVLINEVKLQSLSK